METTEPTRPPITSLILLAAAAGFWTLSLLLPAFAVVGYSTAGWEAMVMGIVMGWSVGGWAVYGNLFFIVSAVMLLLNRSPTPWMVCALLLVCTLPLFQGVPEVSSGSVLHVVSWGWGAVLWVLAHLLLSLAVVARAVNGGRRFVVASAATIAGALGFLGWIHVGQARQANLQEQALYIGPGMAFTVENFCGVPLVMPAGALVDRGESAVLDMDPALAPSNLVGASVWLPDLGREMEFGHEWEVHRYWAPHTEIAVLADQSPSRYALIARRTQGGALLRIEERTTGKVIYEQPLRLVEGSYFCPTSSNDSTEIMIEASGYDRAIERALAFEESELPWFTGLQADIASELCDPGIEPDQSMGGARAWDGRQVRLTPASLADGSGRCSAHYALLMDVRSQGGPEATQYHAVVDVFERDSLRPVVRFSSGHSCELGAAGCERLDSSEIHEAVLAGKTVVIKTARESVALSHP